MELVLFTLLIVGTMLVPSQTQKLPDPHVKIIEPDYELEPGEILWERVNNGTGIFSRSKSTLELLCTAPYPIQWKISGFVDPVDIIIFQQARRFLSEDLENTFEIRVFAFCGEDTSSSAWVECQSTSKPEVHSTGLAVFVPGPRVFVENIKNNNGSGSNTLRLKDTLTLPCGVTDPTLSVQISFYQNEEDLVTAKGIYDAVNGFTLKAPVAGTYVCETPSEERLTIILTFSQQSEISPQETSLTSFTTHNLTLKCGSSQEKVRTRIQVIGNATVVHLKKEPNLKVVQLYGKGAGQGRAVCSVGDFKHTWNYEFIESPRVYIDNFEGEAVCLTDRADRSVSTVRCKDSVDCQFQAQCFQQKEKCNSDRLNYFENLNEKRCWLEKEGRGAACASIPFHYWNGLIECRVGPIRTLTEFFVSLRMKRYTNWKDAPRNELVRIEKEGPTTFFCEATSFLFADSLKFQLEFKGGAREFVNHSKIKNPSREDERKIDEVNVLGILRLEVPSNAVAVLCLAPWWNSTGFMEARLSL